MHEMSLIRNVVDIVLRECEGKNVKEVKKVYLTIGEMSDVVEQYIPGLFRHLAGKQESKIAANADVVIKRTPLLVRCNQCYEIFHLDTHDNSTWVCPRCGVKDYALFSGREFRIDDIEVELFTPEEIAAQQAAAAQQTDEAPAEAQATETPAEA